MFGNLGFGEILIILLVILLLFGAKRIPEVAGSMGKGIREFKRSLTDVENSIANAGRDDRSERLRSTDAVPPRAEPQSEEETRHEPKRLLS